MCSMLYICIYIYIKPKRPLKIDKIILFSNIVMLSQINVIITLFSTESASITDKLDGIKHLIQMATLILYNGNV